MCAVFMGILVQIYFPDVTISIFNLSLLSYQSGRLGFRLHHLTERALVDTQQS